jgi:hypothetical protein
MSDTQATPPPPPPPEAPAPAAAEEPKASGLMRFFAVLVTLVLLFGVAVMVIVVINPDNLPLCEEVASGEAQLGPTNECLDSSQTEYTLTRILAGAAALVGGLAALLGLAVAFTGRRGSLFVKLTVVALVLGGLTFLIGEI